MSGSPSMRVAVLGKPRSILTWFADTVEGFRLAGAEVRGISFQTEGVRERAAAKAGHGKELDNPETVARTTAELAAFSPDLVVVLNKAGLPPAVEESWRGVLGARVPVVGWLCDCLNEPPPGQVAAFDGVYYFDTWCEAALDEFYRSRGGVARMAYLPLAVDPARFPYRVVAARKPWLVFAGKCSAARREEFARLRGQGIRLDVYGPGSGDWLRPWRGRRYGATSLAEIYRTHLACLNIPQPGNTEYGLNLRAFETPCCGGVGTYPDVPDVPRCFVPGEEILIYRSPADLAEQLDGLRSDPSRAERIAQAGRRRVLADHTFEARARRMLADWMAPGRSID